MITAAALALLIFAPAAAPFAFDTPAPTPEPYTVECSATTPAGCVERVYSAVYDDAPLTLGDLLALTAYGELDLFYDLGHGDVASEALFRSWFDPQSGACPSGYDCTYTSVIAYLTTSQAWRDSISGDTVNLSRLYGRDEAYLDYTDVLEAALADNPAWYTGQSSDHASQWGTTVIEPGAVAYDWPSYASVITHVYGSGGYSFGNDVRAGELPVCSYYSAIVDIENRFRVSTCGNGKG